MPSDGSVVVKGISPARASNICARPSETIEARKALSLVMKIVLVSRSSDRCRREAGVIRCRTCSLAGGVGTSGEQILTCDHSVPRWFTAFSKPFQICQTESSLTGIRSFRRSRRESRILSESRPSIVSVRLCNRGIRRDSLGDLARNVCRRSRKSFGHCRCLDYRCRVSICPFDRRARYKSRHIPGRCFRSLVCCSIIRALGCCISWKQDI